MILPVISHEQNNIITLLKDNKNIVVDSVAGSGKTTTNLYIAKAFPELKLLLLTYNAKLKIETREKINDLGITNLETHSYHSFCVKYYNNKCFTDYEIKNLINLNTKLLKKIKYDIIILDEAQDITNIYYELICKIYKDNTSKKTQICLLGDVYQSIYDFNNADPRFIVYSDELFDFNKLSWNKCKLSQSYRVTKETADFINICLFYNSDRIRSEKISNNKPTYIVCNTFCDDVYALPFVEIKKYLDLGYKPDEIFILAPSVKSNNSPVRILENLIKLNIPDIPIYVPCSDEEKLDEDILKNKLVFSSFHQAKGLERKVVIIFGFDESYFKYYKKDINPAFCPNEFYVAVTRASEHLVLLHDNKHDYFEFLNINKIKEYCNYICNTRIIKYNKDKIKKHPTPVTDLIKHLPIDIINTCLAYFNIEYINKEPDKINIPIKIGNDENGYESVSEITGTVIPAYFEYEKFNTMTIFNVVMEEEKSKFPKNENYNLDNIKLENIKEDELLYISNLYCSLRSGFLFKTYQIKNYDWLSTDNLTLCLERLNKLNISNNAKFEVGYTIESTEAEPIPELTNRRLIGYIDCVDGNNIYEFKCVQKLENEHILQLGIYMYLNEIIIRKELNNKLGEIVKEYKNNIHKNNIKISKLKMIKKINDLNLENESLNYKINEITKELKYPNNIITNNYWLYNILSDEMIKISCNFFELTEMIRYLIYEKYKSNKIISDDDFILKFKNIFNKYK